MIEHPVEPAAELTPLKRAFLAIEELQGRLAVAQQAGREPVAIVGIGCRLPGGADDPEALWTLLKEGVDAIGDVPADRWDIDEYYDPDFSAPGKMSTRHGGFVAQVDEFDPQFFGISPREAASMDPQQRLLLEVAWEALEHAGIAPDGLGGSRTGVFVGVATNDYAQIQLESQGVVGLDAYHTSGTAHSILSGRLSYVLGLNGPSITLDTACSSSLVAVHLAVQSLRSGECRMALAGGVNLILSPENSIMLSKYQMMAPDGRCKTFDAAADGFVRGEGCGLIVVKRLADAIADGDRVLAVIRGSALNQDGASSGLTAPNGPSQEAVIRDALANAGVSAHEVGYVEAHGTGTALGDPIEIQALAAALGAGRPADAPVAVGSVKTNLGHLESVAGVAGLIKAVLVLQHGVIPPHLHFHQPNPHIDWESLPVVVPTTLTPWTPTAGRRVAGVSSFGFSGTNAHVVLEEAPVATPAAPVDERPAHVVALSARSESALRVLAGRLGERLEVEPELSLADVCYTAGVGRAQFAHRLALVADTTADAAHRLAAIAAGDDTAVIAHVEDPEPPKVAWLFTGQGAQYPGMAAGLYRSQRVFREAFDRCAAVVDPLLGCRLVEVVFGGGADGGDGDVVHQTRFTQPALFAVEYGLAELWQSWGVRPQAVVGHSLGEYVAAVVAGVWSVEDGLRLVVARAGLMQELPAGGAMTAIFAPVAEVAAAVAGVADRVSVAAVNGAAHTVISGVGEVVAEVAGSFAAAGVRVQPLKVSHAFHSPLIEPMLAEFAAVLSTVQFNVPRVRLISNLTGRPAGAEITEPAYWLDHIRNTVQFDGCMKALDRLGCSVFVEIGPHPTLLGMARADLPPDAGIWLPSLRRGHDEWRQILESLAALYRAGLRINWAGFDAPYERTKVQLPTYPFERQRHWVRTGRHSARRSAAAGSHPLLGVHLRSPLSSASFEAEIDRQSIAYLDDHRVFGTPILPATAFIETALAAVAAELGDGGCILDDLVIHEALIVDDDEPCTIQTILTPEDGAVSFKIFSVGAMDDAWRLHASGRARLTDVEDTFADLDEIRARCLDEVSAEAHYGLLGERGLDFGPSLRGVRRLWKGANEALADVDLAEPQAREAGTYRVHPALLDACIQALADLVPSGDATYLPIGIDRVTLYDSPVGDACAHVVLHPGTSLHERPETLAADVFVLSTEGRVLVAVDGLRLKRADRQALTRLARQDPFASWLHEVAWRAVPASSVSVLSADFIPDSTDLARQVGEQVDVLRAQHSIDRYQQFLDELEALSTDHIVLALERLGLPATPGARFTSTDIAVAERHRRLLGRLLEVLVEDAVIRPAVDGWEVLRTSAVGDTSARWESLIARYPEGRGELAIGRRCGEQLAEALADTVDPLQLLFPGGSLEDAEQMYQASPIAHFYNSLVGATVATALAELPIDRTVRVLEIGAGTGGTTGYVLPELPPDRSDYVFTDVSPHFLNKARQKFSAYPFVKYQPLDIEGDPGGQGFVDQQFDVIVATNVLHATVDLRRTFDHVGRLLAPGGLLILVEMIRSQRFIDISFGLTEGWWKFSDTDLRPSSLLLDRAGWLRFLADHGFTAPHAVPAADTPGMSSLNLQAVVAARAPDASGDAAVLPDGKRRWLLLTDPGGVGVGVAELLADRGGDVVVATSASDFRRVDQARFELDPTKYEDLSRLIEETAADGPIDGVVHLLSLGVVEAGRTPGLDSALTLVQALVRSGTAPRLWLVTRGAQPAGRTAPTAELAPLWGFGKVVGLEHPELRSVCVDLDPSPIADAPRDLLDALMLPGNEDQLALRHGELLVARLTRALPPVSGPPVELAVSDRGTLDNLVFLPMTRKVPGAGEVEIRVHATGLNFKDVLNALGMYPGDPGPLGGECAGTIVAVGEGVADLSEGDEVMALVGGSFRSHVIAPAILVVPKPARLTFEEAAGLLIANVTAAFALEHLGKLRAGERVLIHAAAGGVGLAAVQLAQRVGAEIYATVGSDEKRAFLASLGVRNLYDSRSVTFAEAIRADTGCDGVDVVLNSLTGEFITRSLELVRNGGRWLEIGKRDHLSDDDVRRLGDRLAYHVIDWGETAQSDPQLIRNIMISVAEACADGSLSPLPSRTFEFAEAQTAFRYMAQAKHIGKVIVTQSDAPADLPRPAIRPDGTYLITGGLSGLGLLTAGRLVENGARHVALFGRRAPSDDARSVIATLEKAGADILVVSGDVSRRDDVAAALETIGAAMPPLRGVFHAAGALDDGGITQQTWERFRTVLAPKVDGTWHLHELTSGMPLDYFVLYSSVASMFGSPGQANHAAANCYLDALAHQRRMRGQPGLSINWGAWGQVGAAAERGVDRRVDQSGIGVIAPADGLQIMERLMQQPAPQVGVTPINWNVFLQRYQAGGAPPYFGEQVAADPSGTTVVTATAAGPDVRRRLEEAPPHRRSDILLSFVREQAAHVLALTTAQVDDLTPLSALGLDSLMAVELRNLLGAGLALERPLSATLVFDYPTVAAITKHLAELFVTAAEPAAQPEPAPSEPDRTDVASMLDDLENLSDAEIDALLAWEPTMSDMYDRISKLSPKRLALLAIELQSKLDAAERGRSEPIAIVGMACRFPGAATPEAYWQLLRDGVDVISEIPPSRWDVDAHYDPDPDTPAKIATRWGGFLEDVDRFEPEIFGIAPREALSLDPQQRLLLEVSWEALERAGIAPDGLAGSPTGVFVGVCNGDYGHLLMEGDGSDFDMYLATGNAYSVASGRLSYVLGLQGPAISVDTACSSSLGAVHLAVQSLRDGGCRMALAGGSNVILSPKTTMALSRAKMMAPDGRCRPFDAAASGFVRSEGCGVVVLKRLSDAAADGDNVLAVIRGSAMNQDGRSNGLTAPNGPAQVSVIRAALADAGVRPADVSYVETHGTGTSLGDPIEARALGEALGTDRQPDNRLLIGSAKANVGHLEATAGIAGLIKVVLSMQHREIPPLLHLNEPSPYIPWDELPIDLPTTRTPWDPGSGRQVAGVSSFGFSGTNVHIVLESGAPEPTGAAGHERPLHVLKLSARTDSALRATATRIAEQLDARPELVLADVAHTLGVGRADFGHRLALVAGDSSDASAALTAFAAGESTEQVVSAVAPGSRQPEIVFLFTGHGSQYPNMGRRLYETQPVFRAAIDRCAELLVPLMDRPLLDVLFVDGDGLDALLDSMAYSQPALFAVEYALASLWQSWGVRPAAVAGHSAGEYVAAVVAGVISLEDGLRLIAARGRLMSSLPPDGEMAAALTTEERVGQAIAAHGGTVSIAAINGPESVAISGTGGALQAVVADLRAAGVEVRPLAIPIAAHSPQVDPILDAFEEVAATVSYRPPHLDVISGTAGRLAEGDDLMTAAYWRSHLRQPVRFADALRTVYDQGRRVFIEIGPHPTLLGMGRHVLPEDECHWLPSLRSGHDDWEQILRSVASLYTVGGALDWAGFDVPYAHRRVVLPTYPFERERYWATGSGSSRPQRRGSTTGHTLLGQRLHSPALHDIVFETTLGATWPAFLDHHRIYGVAILPSPVYVEMALAAASEALDAGQWTIDDLSIRETLILPDDGERTVQLVIRADEKGAEFEFLSCDRPDGPWTLHADGRLSGAANVAPSATPFDPESIRQRCETRISGADYYEGLFALGLQFGESFRGLTEIWRRDGEALGLVVLPEILATEARGYALHPALLDACFHLLGAPLPERGAQDAYLLVAIDQIRLFAPPAARMWNHTVLRPGYDDGAETFVGDITLRDEDGGLIGEILGIHLKVAGREALIRAIRQSTNDWLYELEWQPSALPAGVPAALPKPELIAGTLTARLAEVGDRDAVESYRLLMSELNDLGVGFAVRALGDLGWAPSVGEQVSSAGLAEALGVITPHRRLFARMLEMVAAGGVLRPVGEVWQVTSELPAIVDLAARAATLRSRYPVGSAAVTLTERCGLRLAEVLRGDVDPLHLLFPGGSHETVESIYSDSPPAAVCNELVHDAVAAAVASLPANRSIRVLEIGGGTASTTVSVLPALPVGRADYCFTDISPVFTARAKERFAGLDHFECTLLDIERDPVEQGFAPEMFDIVIASNVLHATTDVRRSLEHARALIAPGGLLLLVEGTTPNSWVDITFGLTDGWWRFADLDLRPDHPLLDRTRWLDTLRSVGFEHATTLPSPDEPDRDGLALVMARLATRDESSPDPSRWLVLGDGTGLGTALVEHVERSGEHVVLVPPNGSVEEVVHSMSDGRLNIVDLRGLDIPAPDGLQAEDVGTAQAGPVGGALEVAQAALRRDSPETKLWFVTRGAQPAADVVVAPAQASLWGLGRVIAIEQPDVWGGLVDLAPDGIPERDAAAVLAEIRHGGGEEDQVALRSDGRRVARLVRAKSRVAVPFAASRDASYLITGGLGGLGLKVARWLAEHGAGTVVLIGRAGMPARESWDGLPADSRQASQVAQIRAIEALGATVHAISADVADRAAMAAVVARFGVDLPPLRGVVHAAAALSNWPVATMPEQALHDMLRPKVTGTWLLHELTRDVELDFFVLFSSTTAIWGARDLAHYAAANQFLDAFAHHRRSQGLPALSINWGTWDEMRVASDEERQMVSSFGLEPMPSDQALQTLGTLLGDADTAQIVVASVDWATLKGAYESRRARPLLSLVDARRPATPPQTKGPARPELLERLEGAGADERYDIVVDFLRDEVARTLGSRSAQSVDVSQGLFEMGMDSLMSVELKSRIGTAVGATLPSTLTFNYPTVEALAGYLTTEVLSDTDDAPATALDTGPQHAVDDALSGAPDDVDELSEDDLAAMLAARLAKS